MWNSIRERENKRAHMEELALSGTIKLTVSSVVSRFSRTSALVRNRCPITDAFRGMNDQDLDSAVPSPPPPLGTSRISILPDQRILIGGGGRDLTLSRSAEPTTRSTNFLASLKRLRIENFYILCISCILFFSLKNQTHPRSS